MDSSTNIVFISFYAYLLGLPKRRVAIAFALLTVVEMPTSDVLGCAKRGPDSISGPVWQFGPIGWFAFAKPDRGLSEMLAGLTGGDIRSQPFGTDDIRKECRG